MSLTSAVCRMSTARTSSHRSTATGAWLVAAHVQTDCQDLPEESRNREFNLILKRQPGPWAEMVGEHVAAIVCMHEHDESQLLRPDREKAFICQKRMLECVEVSARVRRTQSLHSLHRVDL